MPGLNLGAGAQVKATAQSTYGSVPAPATSMAAGFGIDTNNSADEGIGALSPTHPAGLAVWWGVLATIGLVFLYKSLPA
jgi:hypothetical protein